MSPLEDVAEVRRLARAARRDHGHLHRLFDELEQVNIIARALAVAINAVDHELAGTQGRRRDGHRDGTYRLVRAAATRRRAPPAPRFTRRPSCGRVRDHQGCRRAVFTRWGVLIIRKPHSSRVERHDDGLPSVFRGDLLYRRFLGSRRIVALRGLDRIRADAHLVGACSEISVGDVERRDTRAVGRRVVPDAAADRQRHEAPLRSFS
mmetsp:Transcript_14984/g.42523  ORF Transcript_14984/g.42523 Transcript_14984/m.42523 type:complete len:207 (+) Transcript_14984:115-735(+)